MARHFSGNNDVIEWGDPTFMDGETLICVHAFANIDSTGATQGILTKRQPSAPNAGFAIGTSSGTQFNFTIDDGVDNITKGSITQVQTGTWQAIGFSFIALNATGFRFYVGGSEDGNSPRDASSIEAFVNTPDNLMAGRLGTSSWDLLGHVAEVAIWTGVTLGAADFAALAAGTPATAIEPANLDFYAPLGIGGAAGPDPDIVGGLDGILGGGTLPTVSTTHPFMKRGVGMGINMGIRIGL